jgi:virulence-associated protein VagC
MTELVMNTEALLGFLQATFPSEKVRVRENNRVVTIEPFEQDTEKTKLSDRLRGMLKDYPDMSVDKFLERKHADKELDL